MISVKGPYLLVLWTESDIYKVLLTEFGYPEFGSLVMRGSTVASFNIGAPRICLDRCITSCSRFGQLNYSSSTSVGSIEIT